MVVPIGLAIHNDDATLVRESVVEGCANPLQGAGMDAHVVEDIVAFLYPNAADDLPA